MIDIALCVSCCDSVYWTLATIALLSSGTCTAKELDAPFLGITGLWARYHTFQEGVSAVTLSRLFAFECAFTTALASIIFTVEAISVRRAVRLQQATWFAPVK